MKPLSIGITPRTALLSWLVTLATLAIFAAAIVPWQQRLLQAGLDSKARSVTLALREVIAGAAVNEDYSTIVDYCKEMLQGDDSLAYIVITKNDGFSLIQDRDGWRSETAAAPEWRPAGRTPVSGIRHVPLFQRRVFNSSQPFDYSGIEWGWIHVGLSLDTYDRSVSDLYRRTAVVSIACIGLSLLASLGYARRLVRPLLQLQATVRRIAGGDLTSRAAEERGDELGELASSVNQMTGALVHRDRILGCVQSAAQRFLSAAHWSEVTDAVLAQIGTAADASRTFVCANRTEPDGRLFVDLVHEWSAPGLPDRRWDPDLQDLNYQDAGLARWTEAFPRREIIAARTADLPAAEQPMLLREGIRSILAIPVLVEDRWWGFLGLADCARDRPWTDAERDSVQAIADMLGAAIARRLTQDALLESKATLEQRVLERTVELQRENLERKEAEAALARSASVLNATLESTVDGILVLDRQAGVKHFNRRFLEMWGTTAEFLTSGRYRHVLSSFASQLERPREFIQYSLRLHFDPVAESFDTIVFKDGRAYETYTRPQQADGVSSGRVWVFRDITERRRAELAVAYERDLLQTLLDSLPDTLYFKDLESRFVRVSRSKVESALAYLRARHEHEQPGAPYPAHLQDAPAVHRWLAGRTDLDVLPAADARPRLAEEQEIIRTGRPVMGKIESIALPGGGTRWYLVTKMPWRDPQGRLIGTYGISKDITPLKEAEEKVAAIHQQLMEASRQAGMAEVATGVLHNVGNVLNSVNVSATLVREKLQDSEVATLGRVAALLREHSADLPAFLTADPRGRLLPGFVIELADHLAREHEVLRSEHEQLARNVEHIKEIVAMQQSYARVSGVREHVALPDLLADALRINQAGLIRHGVEVVRDYAEVPPVLVDKHKVLQILVNLVHNAKYALDAASRPDRRITITVRESAPGRVRIAVADNGVGIPPENLTRIFSRGFTTRPHGHGFGLHSGAIAAREMGGSLHAASAGPGQGATFTLEIPVAPAATPPS